MVARRSQKIKVFWDIFTLTIERFCGIIVSMKKLARSFGFTLVEMLVAVAVFALFSLGLYSAMTMVFKSVYASRINIIATALLDERLEIARNLPFDQIGIINGLPAGILPHTTTTLRNGVPFLITTVVRSIDDPFDGTLGGTPNDTAPADYKFIEIAVRCVTCDRKHESSVSTIIPPRDLEGDTTNGAIFILVTDSHNNPVSNAAVHLENTSIVPNIIIDDVTDKDGYLKIVDTPTGTMSYNISATKEGFNVDNTIASSTENPNPIKRPITVSAQQVSDVYFSIDQLSSLTVHTLDESCESAANADFTVKGAKLIGTPGLYKYDKNLQTDSEGNLNLNDLEFDKYSFITNNSLDLVGSIPMVPYDLGAGSHGDVTLILAPHVPNSLLVRAVDDATGLPLSDASVTLKKTGYHSVLKTSYGFISQTDWSGGPGETTYSDQFPNKYDNDMNVDTVSSPGNIMLSTFAGHYVNEGIVESSIFDIGKKVDLKSVEFTSESMPIEAGDRSILIQIAKSNSSTPSSLTNFVGPDGTAASYFSTTSTIVTGGNGYRYFRYRLYLSTLDQNFSPIFSDLAVTFTSGCTPPGQVFFKNISSGTYDLGVTATGYDEATTTVNVSGYSSSTLRLYKTI
jgi:prepilin-type N-terminal cleavage/methylation domain-containing protein